MRFIRPFITAIAVLALTAMTTGAHEMPSASVDGLATAFAASGKVVPVGHQTADEVQQDEQSDELTTEDEVTDETETTDETDAVDSADSHCIAPETEEDTTDEGTTDEGTTEEDTTTEETAEPNHGAIVCGAAQAETPDGYANHGQYVREFARDNHGAEQSAAAKSKHSGDDASTAAATSHGKGHGRNK